MVDTDARARLRDIVEANGVIKGVEPMQLSSGEWSTDFVDCKRALAAGDALALACRLMVEQLDDAGIAFDAVGGLTMGADQFAHGVAVVASKDWFVVRKQPKGRGTNKRVEGADIGTGTRVFLVDDVVTTGGSIQQAHEQVLATGATVVAASTLVDRGDVATEWFGTQGVPYLPLFTYRDFGLEPVGRAGASSTS